jgi:hypothetical protein
MDMVFQREMIAFEEKIALAKLEEAKAAERVRELEYQKSRFNLEYFLAAMKEQQLQQQKQPVPNKE